MYSELFANRRWRWIALRFAKAFALTASCLLAALAARRYRRRLAGYTTQEVAPPPQQPTTEPRTRKPLQVSCCPDLVMTKPCRWLVTKGRCQFGDKCDYAHSAEELRPFPESQRLYAEHWKGDVASIGYLETGLFNEKPPPGTADVICDRSTHLGNPFACRIYCKPDEAPPKDKEGWRPSEHEEVCNAFDEYLSIVLDPSGAADEPLSPIVAGMAFAKSMEIGDTWLSFNLTRGDVLKCLDGVIGLVVGGVKLRLLCHCKPHVRCHTEALKRYIEGQAKDLPTEPSAEAIRTWTVMEYDVWPIRGGHGPDCEQCGRQGRGIDPGNMRVYCSYCWMKFADDTKWKADYSQWQQGSNWKSGYTH